MASKIAQHFAALQQRRFHNRAHDANVKVIGASLGIQYRPVVAGSGRDPTLKGKKDANCNREACQSPGAYFYNTGTQAYYCASCARDIHQFNIRCDDGFVLYPDFDKTWAAMEKLLLGEAKTMDEARAKVGL